MPLPGNGTLSLQGPSRLGDAQQSKPKQAMLVRMSAETLEALEDHPKMEFEFGENPGIYIAGTFYPMRAQEENADHELYLRSTLASKPGAPLKLYANVIGKFMVERQLGERMQNKMRDRTQQAEKQRLERKTQLLDAPLAIPSTTKSAASKKPKVVSVKRAAPPESRMLSTTSSSQPSRMVSPRPPVSTETPGLKERLIHCAALQDRTTEELIKMLASGTAATLRKEVTELIPQVLEQIPAPKNSINPNPKWSLKLESWKLVRPYDWPSLEPPERLSLARKTRLAFNQLRIPESDPIWDRARNRDLGTASDTHRASPVPSGAPKRPIISQVKKAKTADGSVKRKLADTITAKDESVKVPKVEGRAREREREESTRPTASSSAAPLASARRVPGSGFKTKSNSATPPLDSTTAAHTAKKQDLVERQAKRETSTAGSSRSTAPTAEDRRVLSESGAVRKRPTDSAASRVAESDRERGRNSPLPSAGQKRKAPPRDGAESDYSERGSVTASTKKRKLEERDRERERGTARGAERDRPRDLAPPKKPVRREPSPLPPIPKQKITKRDASPIQVRTKIVKREASPSPALRGKTKREPSPPPVPKMKPKPKLEPSQSPALPPLKAIPQERVASVASTSSTRSRADAGSFERNGSAKSRRGAITWSSSSSDEKDEDRKPDPDRKRREAKPPPQIPATLPEGADDLRRLWKSHFPSYIGTYHSLSMARAKIERMMMTDASEDVSSADEDLLDVEHLQKLRDNFDKWTKDMERIATKLTEMRDQADSSPATVKSNED